MTATPRGESRWPAAIAALIAVGFQFRLPSQLSFGPAYLVPGLALLLLIPLLVANPGRLTPHSKDFRALSIALIAAINLGNVTSLALLLHRLLHGSSVSGRRLVYSAVEIWATGVIVFGLWLWELDRGGPLARVRAEQQDPDLLFPQMTDPSFTTGPWTPTFIDYLYVSLTNSTAFSPTDTMPLRVRTKLLLGAQSIASLATVAVVGARAVNILK